MSKRSRASRASSVATESSEEYITPDVAPTTRKRKKLDGVREDVRDLRPVLDFELFLHRVNNVNNVTMQFVTTRKRMDLRFAMFLFVSPNAEQCQSTMK